MPIYEFACRKCGHTFEVLYRASDGTSKPSCPNCKSKKTEKQMSVCGGKFGNASAGGGKSCSAASCPPS